MDQRLSTPGLGRMRAGCVSLALCAGLSSANAFTLTTTPSEVPAVRTEMVGQAALDEAFNAGEGASLQLSDALTVHALDKPPPSTPTLWLLKLLQGVLSITLALWVLHTLRQWLLTLNRVSDPCWQPHAGLVEAAWPKLSVVVLAHDSQALVGESLGALMASDYPLAQLQVVVVNDRSTDRTRQIIDEQVARHAGRMVPVHRKEGHQGRAACLLSAMPHVDGDFLLILGAEDRVGPACLKQLMAPFFDPEVGAVTGRSMPSNVSANWMTRLTDLALSAEQQVGQQARANLGLLPQHGGLVAWRRSALVSACAASSDAMADAVDVAHRLSLRGWLQVYQACLDAHRVVPQTWGALREQVLQLTQAQHRSVSVHLWPMLVSRHLSAVQKFDALLAHLTAFLPVLLVLSGVCLGLLHFLSAQGGGAAWLAWWAVAVSSAWGGKAPHFQAAVGARLDGRQRALRLMPLHVGMSLPLLMTQARFSGLRLARLVRKARAATPAPWPRLGQAPSVGRQSSRNGTAAPAWASQSEAA